MGSPRASEIEARSVADAFGLGDVLSVQVVHRRGGIELARFVTDRGDFAVKTRPVEDDAVFSDGLRFEVAAARAGLPMPAPVPLLSGPLASGGGGFSLVGRHGTITVHDWVDVTPYRGQDVSVWLGGVVARMHALATSVGSTLPASTHTWTYGPTSADWAELAERGRARDLPWAPALERALPELEVLTAEVQRAVRRHPSTGFVHPDLEPRNIVQDRSGQWLLLDWDHARRESLPLHLAHAALLVAMVGGEPDPRRIGGTVDAYCAAGGTPPTTTDGLLARRLGLRLVRLADVLEHWADDGTPADLPHVLERLEGLGAFREQLYRWAALFPVGA